VRSNILQKYPSSNVRVYVVPDLCVVRLMPLDINGWLADDFSAACQETEGLV